MSIKSTGKVSYGISTVENTKLFNIEKTKKFEKPIWKNKVEKEKELDSTFNDLFG